MWDLREFNGGFAVEFDQLSNEWARAVYRSYLRLRTVSGFGRRYAGSVGSGARGLGRAKSRAVLYLRHCADTPFQRIFGRIRTYRGVSGNLDSVLRERTSGVRATT